MNKCKSEGIGRFNIVLEQGSATKPFGQFTEEDMARLNRRVMAKVKWRCRKFGTMPIVRSPSDDMSR